MKPLLLLSLSLTAALGIPLSPQVKQSSVLKEEKEPTLGNVSPLLGDYVPAQGHVEVENPAPPPVLTPMKEQKPPPPEDQNLSQNMVELEVKVNPEVQKKKELKAAEEEEAGKELKEKMEEGGIVELKLEVKPEAQGVEELETEAETKEEEAKIESEKEHEFDSETDLKVELEVKLDEASLIEDVEMEEKSEAAAAEEAETQSENEEDFKVESETKIELETQGKEEPEEKFMSAQEKFEVHLETAERHIDMEKPQEGHPFVESPEDDDDDDDDDDDTVLFEEQEDEELLMKKNDHLDEQRVSEMEPEAVLGEEPDVHQMFQQEPFSENSLAEKKPLAVQEPKREEEGEAEHEFPESALKDPQTERRFCAGVASDSKCYQFFTGPRTFKDAEYFCLQQFSGGHLASITSEFIHREVLKLILQQNGSYTRAWVGGYRLDRNHFIWMDGSLWSYADWLSGEPNHTSGMEDCLEVLGNFGSEPGKFNDFTCWTPQAFVCSYPHH